MESRALLLALLNSVRPPVVPCFSCLSTVILPALEARGLHFAEVHHDPAQMALASASAHELYRWPSATLPTDLCVEAQALGAEIDFRADMPEPMWPLVAAPLFESPQDLKAIPANFVGRARIPLVLEALAALKARVGITAVVGAWIPGPFTLAMQVMPHAELLAAVSQSPEAVGRALDLLVDALIPVGLAYRDAGADYITIHEMGGSPGVLGPRSFRSLVLPRLQRLITALPAPRILSVCGSTNRALDALAETGAEALNVDQKTDLARARGALGDKMLLFGNLDPVGLIAQGDALAIQSAVARAAEAGVDAIMPGCDLYLETPAENLRAVLQAAAERGGRARV